MMDRRWQLVVLGLMVFSVALTGCKKKPKPGMGMGDAGVGGVIGEGAYGEGALGDRPEGAMETAGQFSPVYFDYDSAQVNPAEQAKIQAVADYLRGNAAGGVIVEGHCDERGSNEYNLALGERRALAIRAALIGLGADASRVQTKSLGEERPAAMGHDESSWAQNRRGEFVLFQ
jgi:peptidoglycan-associated lipoprotein